MLWAWLFSAFASGPWVPGTGRTSLYLGIDGQRFTRVSASGDGASQKVDVGDGIQTVAAVAHLTHGLTPRIAVEFTLPVFHGHASRTDAEICSIGLDACAPTNVVGVLQARVKGLMFDELSGSPLSVALEGEVRYGGLHATSRARLTAPGAGTLDFGPVVSVGRSGGLGSGYFASSLDLGWRYRVPHTRRYPQLIGDRSVPASEFHGAYELILAPIPAVGFGPAVGALLRPWGVDFLDLDGGDIDRFSALRVGEVRVGLKAVFKDEKHNAFVVSADRTVFAWNNPRDNFGLAIGVNITNLFSREGG